MNIFDSTAVVSRDRKEEDRKKKGILERLPRLSRTSQTVLILAILVAMFLPTYLIYYQQPKMRATLQASLASLQKVLDAEETPKVKLETELTRIEEETAATRAIYPDPSHVPELVNDLIELAKENGATVTNTKVSVTKLQPPKEKAKGPAPKEMVDTVLNVDLSLKGQVAHFQNFLLALDRQFPTARIKKAAFTIHSEEGTEDTCELSLLVLCYPQEKTK